MVNMGILIGVFIVAVFADWRYYRIPNPCIAAGTAAGLVMTYLSCSLAGMLEALAGMFLIFAAFYPFYLLRGIGAGDVKLFMMLCCYVRGDRLIRCLLVTMLLAAAVSVGKMALYAESRERLFYLGRYLRKAVLTGTVDEYHIDRTRKRCVIRLSVPALASLLLMCMHVY